MTEVSIPTAAPWSLSRPELLRQDAFIAGRWVNSGSSQIEVCDPADNRLLGRIPNLGEQETRQAITAAAAAFERWRLTLAEQRAAVLQEWARLMRDHEDDLALLMTSEQGKPLSESKAEIRYAASFLSWFSEEARRMYGDTIPSHLPDSRLLVTREPIGVVAAITPWNFPSAMVTRKVGAALAAGCTIVIRPASETPFSALALACLGDEAGLPRGVLSVVTGNARPIAAELTSNRTVRAFSFTGSTEVGRHLLAQCASTIKKVSMELGGHAPFLVLEDADFDHSVSGAVAAKFTTSGQDCLAANRIFVHESLYERFVNTFSERVRKLRVGRGRDAGVEVGPLINEEAVRRLETQIEDALSRGARLTAGGGRHKLGGTFFEPSVVADVSDEMLIHREETFGPLAAISSFSSEDDVIGRANGVPYGLAAYVYTRDVARAFRSSDRLDYGMIGINTPRFAGAPIPFGGRKESGVGREGSRYGLDEFTELKYVCFGHLGTQRAVD